MLSAFFLASKGRKIWMSLIKTENLAKQSTEKSFQHLLRELFSVRTVPIWTSEIYRVMNYKRDAIERFISDELPQGMREEKLQSGGLGPTAPRTAEKTGRRSHAHTGEFWGAMQLMRTVIWMKRFRETPLGREYMIS